MRLRMAPRMIQSMEILQLPIMALQERIEQELGENPVLEDRRKNLHRREVDGDEADSGGDRTRGRYRAERVRYLDRTGRKLERTLRRRATSEPSRLSAKSPTESKRPCKTWPRVRARFTTI